MSMLRVKFLLIFVFCFFVYYTALLAEDTSNSGLATIDSVTTVHSHNIVGKKISFKGTFRDPGAMEEYSIVWDFGDGNVATGKLAAAKDVYANPGRCTPYKNMYYNYSIIKADNTYSKPGSYTISFSVEDSKGTKHQDSRVIVVEEK